MKAKLKKVKKPVKLLKAKKKVIDPKNKKKLETVSTDEFMRDFMKDVQETSRKSNEVNKGIVFKTVIHVNKNNFYIVLFFRVITQCFCFVTL